MPTIIERGQFQNQYNIMHFCIMPRYAMSMDIFLQSLQLNEASVADLGLALLTQLECIHAAGYIHNDLKLNNMMVGYQSNFPEFFTNQNIFRDATVHLIDFGCATLFQNKYGVHYEQKTTDKFRGNMHFASAN